MPSNLDYAVQEFHLKIRIPIEPKKLQADHWNKTLEESKNKNMSLAFQRWVPVAPVGTSDLAEFFRELNVPTMLVYGQKDTGLGHRYGLRTKGH